MNNKTKKPNNSSFFLIIIFLILYSFDGFSQSSDWLQWRGPNANGVSPETEWSPQAALKDNAKLWEINVGTGFPAPIVKGNKLYTLGNFEKNDSTFYDRVVCLNSDTGEEVWNFEYSCKEFEDPGPFSTPLYNEGYLYTLSREGHFFCFNADNGNIIWKHNLIKEDLTTKHDSDFLVSSAPVVYKNLVIVNLNKSGIAFDKKTGMLKWNSEKIIDNFNISTPVLFKNNNKAMYIIQTEKYTSAVNPLTGKKYWEINTGAMPEPIIDKNAVYQFSRPDGFNKYIVENDTIKKVWNNSEVTFQCQNYVIKEKYTYGFGQGKLQCLSLETGEIIWGEKFKEGGLILSNNILIILDRDGNLVFAEANPTEYKEIVRIKAIENPKSDQKNRGYRRVSGCFTNPVLSNGKIYLRSSYGILMCFDVSNN